MTPEDLKSATRLANRRDKADAELEVLMAPYYRDLVSRAKAIECNGEATAKLQALREEVEKWPRHFLKSEAMAFINFTDREL